MKKPVDMDEAEFADWDFGDWHAATRFILDDKIIAGRETEEQEMEHIRFLESHGFIDTPGGMEWERRNGERIAAGLKPWPLPPEYAGAAGAAS